MPYVKKLQIMCAGCGKQHPDLGKRQTCERCGTSPLPSYQYVKGSGLHPLDCGCAVEATSPVRPPARVAGEPELTL